MNRPKCEVFSSTSRPPVLPRSLSSSQSPRSRDLVKALLGMEKVTTTETGGEKDTTKEALHVSIKVALDDMEMGDDNDFAPYILSEQFDTLPSELIMLTLNFFTVKDLCVASMVSKSWNELCNSPDIWRRICGSEHGCSFATKRKKITRPLPKQTWKQHCTEIVRCVKANMDGKRVDLLIEDQSCFAQHAIYVPSLLVYLLVDIGYASVADTCDWQRLASELDFNTVKKPEEEPVTAINMDTTEQPQPESTLIAKGCAEWERHRENWVEFCRSALLKHRAQDAATILQRALLALEMSYTDEAFMRLARQEWISSVHASTTAEIHEVADHLEKLERNIKWSSVMGGWREERTPWRTDLLRVSGQTATQRRTVATSSWGFGYTQSWNFNLYQTDDTHLQPVPKISKALLDMEQHISWDAMFQRWRVARHDWTCAVRAASTLKALLRLLFQLESNLRHSSFDSEWRQSKRALWFAEIQNVLGVAAAQPTRQTTNTITTESEMEVEDQDADTMHMHEADFEESKSDASIVNVCALLIEFEGSLLAGCFLSSWNHFCTNWRGNLHVGVLCPEEVN